MNKIMKKASCIVRQLSIALLMAFLLMPVIGAEPSLLFGAGIVLLNYMPLPANILGMNNTNNLSARESFRCAKEVFFKAWLQNFGGDAAQCLAYVESLKLSQGEIRLEVELNATANAFVFGLTASQQNSTGVIFNTENRLTLQDSMVANEYGIFVGQPTSRIDTTWKMRTYGNLSTFAAADAAALDSTFFSHGSLGITANNDVVMPYRGLFNHWFKGQTQQTAALGAASPDDQVRGAEDGFITAEPNILLIGSKGYKPIITLPVNLASAAAFERCVLIFRGVLAQNSTVVS